MHIFTYCKLTLTSYLTIIWDLPGFSFAIIFYVVYNEVIWIEIIIAGLWRYNWCKNDL